MTTGKRVAPRDIKYDDVDDIIGVAAELSDLERERLSVEDLTAVAKDLEIPEQYVRPAIAELARRREAQLAALAARKKRRNLVILIAAAVVFVLVVMALVGNTNLGHLAADAAAKRAQVVNVVERQRETTRLFPEAPAGSAQAAERAAELAGAANRVRVERQRYDQAAAAYNAAAGTFPGSLWAAIFGHPDALPLSDQIGGF